MAPLVVIAASELGNSQMLGWAELASVPTSDRIP